MVLGFKVCHGRGRDGQAGQGRAGQGQGRGRGKGRASGCILGPGAIDSGIVG